MLCRLLFCPPGTQLRALTAHAKDLSLIAITHNGQLTTLDPGDTAPSAGLHEYYIHIIHTHMHIIEMKIFL